MTDTVILHIGTHKTGSSSIQQSLRGYDDSETFYATFTEADHSKPMFAIFKDDFFKYHSWVNQGLKRPEMEEKRREYRASFEAQLQRKDRRRMIVSAEDISIFGPDEKKALLDCIAAHGCDAEVVCYVREPSGFAASRFQQNIKGGMTACPRRISPFYRFRLATFSQSLPRERIHVRAYDRKKLVDGDVVADFCDVAGLDRDLINQKTANVGLSLPAAKLLLIFNKSNVLCSKERALHWARLKLVRLIQEKYALEEKIPSGIFARIADYSEIDYLRDSFGIDFERKTAEFGAADIDELFSDTSTVNDSYLDDLLCEHGADAGSFTSLSEKLVRLYYGLVAEELSKAA